MEPLLRDISDTARWVAMYRAWESERPDAVFRDPFARRLAGERGERIAAALPAARKHAWAFVTRTWLFDRFVEEQVAVGVDAVVNLAAGLDARPYRMALPEALRWIEVDLPELLEYKERILAGERPTCALERVALDLANVAARRELFARLGGEAQRVLVLTEGLLIYLTAEEVGTLARDLAAPPSLRSWVIDIVSPGLRRMLLKQWGKELTDADAPLRFSPEQGPPFFRSYGWAPTDVRSTLKSAARIGRLSLPFRLIAWLPDSKGRQGRRPWSATCLLERA